MFSSRPIDIVGHSGEWVGSFRFEPYLDRWFFIDPEEAARVTLLETSSVPATVRELAFGRTPCRVQGAYSAPIKVQIQLNSNCNFHCRICYASSERVAISDSLSLNELTQLFPLFKEWGVIRLNFVGGEVFMRKDFPEIVASAQEHRLLVSCITNACIPGAQPERYRDLLSSLWNTQISCNGIGRTYDDEYQSKSWERARQYIANVTHMTKRNILSFVVTARNVDIIPEFMAFASEIKPTVVKFGSVCWSGRSVTNGTRNYYRVTLPKAKEFIRKGRSQYPDLVIQSQLDMGTETPLWEEYINGYRPFEFYFSPEGRDGLYITQSGDIYPFPLLSNKEDLCLGNILTDSLKSIWSGHPILKRLRSVTFENSDCGIIGCESVCGLWNRSYAIAWSDRFDGKVPCEFSNWQ